MIKAFNGRDHETAWLQVRVEPAREVCSCFANSNAACSAMTLVCSLKEDMFQGLLCLQLKASPASPPSPHRPPSFCHHLGVCLQK